MSRSLQAKKICIYSSPVGNGNLGDEMTFAAVIQHIRSRYPDAMIYGLCSNPADTRERHTIAAFPVGRSADEMSAVRRGEGDGAGSGNVGRPKGVRERVKRKIRSMPAVFAGLKRIQNGIRLFLGLLEEMVFCVRSLRILRGTDLFVVSGSGQLSDHFGGVWNFPYTTFKWSLLAKWSSAKVAFLSVGAGPLHSALSRLLIRRSLLMADYRSFRDEGSQRFIEGIGVKGENPVYPDLAHSLLTPMLAQTRDAVGPMPIVGLNAFPYFDPRYWPISNPEAYNTYICKIAAFASWLLENNYSILFFPTQLRADPLVIQDIKDMVLRDKRGDLKDQLIEKTILGVEDLVAAITMTDFVVATRFHGILLSFLLNKPVLAISNHPKMDYLMKDMGQGEYLLDIDRFNMETLKEKFLSLESNSKNIKREVRQIVSGYRQSLAGQYEHVFSLL